MISGRSFVRNSTWNLIGLVLPLALALVAIPALIRGLGEERFGVLTLAWAAVGYFSLFELGLSRALTQAVAHRLGGDDEDALHEIVWPALLALLGLGVLGALAVAVFARVLVTRTLNVPIELQAEAINSFYIVAASLPLVLLSAGLRGLMEAHQHFGLVNALRVPLGAFMFAGPLLALPFSHELGPAMWMLFLGRAFGVVAHAIPAWRRYEYLRHLGRMRWDTLGPLFRFGAWTTVSSIVGPLMVQMDRFFIAAVLPLAAVTHYVTPFELVTKLLIIPSAVVGAAFPAFASIAARAPERVSDLYARSQRAVVVLLFPAVLVTIALAHEGLALWLGRSLPPESATVLQLLALGMFVNSVAYTPLVALQGAGRADLIAKLHLLELPIYAVALWHLVGAAGLVGVAAAWTLRVVIDSTALVVIARRVLGLSVARGPALAGMLILCALLGVAAWPASVSVRVAYAVLGAGGFLVVAWKWLLTGPERAGLLALLRVDRLSRSAGEA